MKQRSVVRFQWAKDLMQMPFSLRCVQCMATSVLQDQQYMYVRCKKFAHGRESVVDKERPGHRVVLTTDATNDQFCHAVVG